MISYEGVANVFSLKEIIFLHISFAIIMPKLSELRVVYFLKLRKKEGSNLFQGYLYEINSFGYCLSSTGQSASVIANINTHLFWTDLRENNHCSFIFEMF